MKRKEKPSPVPAAGAHARLHAEITRLRDALGSVSSLSNGSVVQNAAGRWMWTRKVAGKTVTVALSPEQSDAFRHAIQANREIETTLTRIRQQSQRLLLKSLPGPRRKKARKSTKSPLS